jgi:hypothetical protein
MLVPPDDDEPNGTISGIEEPPIDTEHDTRPLKSLWPRRAPSGRPSSPQSSSATVLRESGPDSIQKLSVDVGVDTDESTDRLRLIPNLPDPPAWRVIFQVGNPQTTKLGLDVRQSLIVGRGEGSDDQVIGLDLTAQRAVPLGVSRQHAVLIPTAEGLLISDLGSKNGTWINGEYLEPGYRHSLASGDQIELGLLKIVVRTVTLVTRSVE